MNMKKELTKYLLIITGFSMLLFFIWFRFIRPRMPKDIPFNLSLLGFILLVYICCIFLYIIISLIRNKDSSNTFIKSIIDFIYKPLITFDIFIKSLSLIEPYYKRFMVYLAYKLDYAMIETNYYYYIFVIFPRIILVSTLSIDTFYFHKLELIYNVILIGIFLLLNRYIIYSLKYIKEQLITELEPLLSEGRVSTPYTEEVYHIGYLEYRNSPEYDPDNEEDDDDDNRYDSMLYIKLRNFIDHQLKYHYNKFRCDVDSSKFYDNNFRKQHNIPDTQKYLTWDQLRIIRIDLDQKMKDIMKVSYIIHYYNISNNDNKYIKGIKIIIFSLYLICWFYILITSIINTVNFMDLLDVLIGSFPALEEPFSGELLIHINNEINK